MAFLESTLGKVLDLVIPAPYGVAVLLAVVVVGWGEIRLAPVRIQGEDSETALRYMLCKDAAIEEHGLSPSQARALCLRAVPDRLLDAVLAPQVTP